MKIAVRAFIITLSETGKLDLEEPAIVALKKKYGDASDSSSISLFDLTKLFFENRVHDRKAVSEIFQDIMQVGSVTPKRQNKLLKVIGSEKPFTIEIFQELICPLKPIGQRSVLFSPAPMKRKDSDVAYANSELTGEQIPPSKLARKTGLF